MSAFPRLKTGAIQQYPAGSSRTYATEILRFVDGSEQRLRLQAGAIERWTVRLTALDEAELALVTDFFETHKGRADAFEFTDPSTGTTYPTCRFDQDSISAALTGPDQASVNLVIRRDPA